jgi:hypothetical protein
MSNYKFGNIDHLKRNKDIEGETGTELGIEGTNITLITLAATDNNVRWRSVRQRVSAELRRLGNAKAPDEKTREYLAGVYSEALVIGWYSLDDKGEKLNGIAGADGELIPFSKEACKQFLMEAFDAYTALEAVVYESKNFRGQRVEVAIEQGKA